jgi:putative FmdB family regulatory protein
MATILPGRRKYPVALATKGTIAKRACGSFTGVRGEIQRRLRQNTGKENPMPIYEYVCNQCANEFEALVRSDTVPECPACQSTELKKVLSVFATGTSAAELVPAAAGQCAGCGHAGGPGACGFN